MILLHLRRSTDYSSFVTSFLFIGINALEKITLYKNVIIEIFKIKKIKTHLNILLKIYKGC